jgi:hypothetical protein
MTRDTDDIPKYIRDGLARQGRDSLQCIIAYAQRRLERLKTLTATPLRSNSRAR